MAKTMWAVGPDDGEGWHEVDAPTELAAREEYALSEYGDKNFILYVRAYRVEAWDQLGRDPNGADWVRVGLSYTCSGTCSGMAHGAYDAKIINGNPYCGECAEDLSA